MRRLLFVVGGMFGFLVLIMAVCACGKKKAQGSLERVVKCKYTEDSQTVQCAAADADACQQLPEQVLCRGPYIDVLHGQINNWKKQGVWSGYENHITWIDPPGIDEPTSHDGKMCWKASLNADVWLCPAKPGAATGRLVGYGSLPTARRRTLGHSALRVLLAPYFSRKVSVATPTCIC